MVVLISLQKMAYGGIYDQLEGGFFRYSVDAEWIIPHFEKMLYDNAQLLGLYATVLSIVADPIFKKVTTETAAWVISQMQAPEGGYYAALDADSEQHEGKFYYWHNNDIRQLLNTKEYDVIALHFGLNQAANFENHWHLYIVNTPNDVAKQLNIPQPEVTSLLQSAKQKLLQARSLRIHPARDEKILTAWNGLMIKSMAQAGRQLQREDFILSAERALIFIKQNLWQNNRLFATYKDKKTRFMAYLDDHAFLIDGILSLLQARWNTDHLQFAIALADLMLEHFEDKEQGGFYFTANDHETLIQRPKNLMDEAIPAGNGIAALVLSRLGHLIGEERYLSACERTLTMAWPTMLNSPATHNSLLNALEEYLYPPKITILRGDEASLAPWQALCNTQFSPRDLCFAIPSFTKHLLGILENKITKPNGVIAYICEGKQCLNPIERLQEFEKVFKK